MQTTLPRLGSICAAALIALAGAGQASAAPAAQTREVVAQLVGPDAPAPRNGVVRTAARAPLALPAAAAVAAGEASAEAGDSGKPSYGMLLLALIGLVLLLGMRSRRRDD